MIDNILQYLYEKMKNADQEGYETSHKGYPQNLVCVNGVTHSNILCEIKMYTIDAILKNEEMPQELLHDILVGMTTNGATTIINTAVLQKLINFVEAVKK